MVYMPIMRPAMNITNKQQPLEGHRSVPSATPTTNMDYLSGHSPIKYIANGNYNRARELIRRPGSRKSLSRDVGLYGAIIHYVEPTPDATMRWSPQLSKDC